MKIVIEVTQEELDEMGLDRIELEDYTIESLDSGSPQGDIDLSGYNVHVKVVD